MKALIDVIHRRTLVSDSYLRPSPMQTHLHVVSLQPHTSYRDFAPHEVTERCHYNGS